MSTLIIVESYFGNTWRIGEALAAACPDATLVRADEAPQQIDDSVELLILGAPTHAFTLPTADSRKAASTRTSVGAIAAKKDNFRPSASGLREWITAASIPANTTVLTFDTCVKSGGTLFGRAAKKAAKNLSRRGIKVQRSETFWVVNDELCPGEIERAAAWATGKCAPHLTSL